MKISFLNEGANIYRLHGSGEMIFLNVDLQELFYTLKGIVKI
ncbi:MAG: hypothetical protein WAU24_12310 [Chitinophagaceae bacterium]